MPPIVQISDHAAVAIEELISFFDNASNLQKLLEILVSESDELEPELVKLWTDTKLTTASGASLDQWGVLVKQPRLDGWTDAQYLAAIQTRIVINLGQGESERLLYVTETLVGVAIWYRQVGQAAYRLVWFISPPTADIWLSYVSEAILELTPAGVEFAAIEGPSPNAFRFDIGPGLDTGELSRYVIHPDL